MRSTFRPSHSGVSASSRVGAEGPISSTPMLDASCDTGSTSSIGRPQSDSATKSRRWSSAHIFQHVCDPHSNRSMSRWDHFDRETCVTRIDGFVCSSGSADGLNGKAADFICLRAYKSCRCSFDPNQHTRMKSNLESTAKATPRDELGVRRVIFCENQRRRRSCRRQRSRLPPGAPRRHCWRVPTCLAQCSRATTSWPMACRSRAA
ncbi:hypothetical protein J2S89_001687 [Arthrobacter bambusae]|nr:hypothetical protein [Arthrobacter bambusae]MDQ0097617.1 hypothetical protein [Arthrobacter bambusae]